MFSLSFPLSVFCYLSLAGLCFHVLTDALKRYFISRLYCAQSIVALAAFLQQQNNYGSSRYNDDHQYVAICLGHRCATFIVLILLPHSGPSKRAAHSRWARMGGITRSSAHASVTHFFCLFLHSSPETTSTPLRGEKLTVTSTRMLTAAALKAPVNCSITAANNYILIHQHWLCFLWGFLLLASLIPLVR